MYEQAGSSVSGDRDKIQYGTYEGNEDGVLTVYEYGNAESANVLIQPVEDHDLDVIENEVRKIQELTENNFRLLAVSMTVQRDREICALICRSSGIKAKDIARLLKVERQEVNHILYSSPLMKELCWQDREYNWHGIMKQGRPHIGLQEFAGYYDRVGNFLCLSEEDWLVRLKAGCINIGRNLNDNRGLFHSFLDSREQMIQPLF